MFKKFSFGLLMIFSMFTLSDVALADNSPTLQQVYQAAHAGKLDEAQSMMNVVLKDHPNSAKAHYVEAEILAKEGQMGGASQELSNAERLQPGLSFANPQAVQDLKNRIAIPQNMNTSNAGNFQAAPHHGFPWGLVLLGVGVIAIIVFVIKAMNARNPNNFPNAYQPGIQNSPFSPMPGQPYGYGNPPMGGGGMGSNIMSGLATGAAVGAGMVAGEALVHHFVDGGNTANNVSPVADSWSSTPDNMGGNDFGIADPGSWDDSSNVAGGIDVGGGDWT